MTEFSPDLAYLAAVSKRLEKKRYHCIKCHCYTDNYWTARPAPTEDIGASIHVCLTCSKELLDRCETIAPCSPVFHRVFARFICEVDGQTKILLDRIHREHPGVF